jgi:hypothetical protein
MTKLLVALFLAVTIALAGRAAAVTGSFGEMKTK